MAAQSSFPAPDLHQVVASVCGRHADQVRMYAKGKSCVGFLVSQVLKAINIDVREAHQAVVTELERRTKIR